MNDLYVYGDHNARIYYQASALPEMSGTEPVLLLLNMYRKQAHMRSIAKTGQQQETTG